jgi:hypothetical protein
LNQYGQPESVTATERIHLTKAVASSALATDPDLKYQASNPIQRGALSFNADAKPYSCISTKAAEATASWTSDLVLKFG